MKMIEGSFLETTKYIKRRIKTICYYFTLAYVDEDSVRFTEIDRFKEQSCAECAPFKNDYVGYAIIDLTEWADKPVNSKLKAFLYYLIDRELSNSKNKVIFFSEKETGTVLKKMIEELYGTIDIINLGTKIGRTSQQIGFILNNQKEKEVAEDVRS